ncbi:MAG: 6-phosphogluconate dehydrogenase, partial [Actinobacteria bacterium]|nr:6-phosphogluconate dehydrogenase [Actinomycetota bacterium]
MGSGLAGKALAEGHEPVGWDPSDEARDRARQDGLRTVASLSELVDVL